MARLLFALTLGTLLCTSQNAPADVATEARFFDEIGRRAYQAGQYEKALEAFQLVQELTPSERMLYNIALCADLAKRGDMAFSLYQEYLKSDDADPARRAEAERRAERLRSKLALIEVTTDPPGAAVYVDRKELGQLGITPVTFAVAEGEHHVLVERDGFFATGAHVAAKTGTLVQVAPALSPVFGRLVVNVTPGTATLTFMRDGRRVVGSLERGGYRLQVGRYQVRATAPGHAPSEAQVVVSESGTAQVDFGLAPLPRATGVLLVSAGPVSADVFVDGRRVAVTPATLRDLSLGRHTLEVRSGSRVARRTVEITDQRPTYVEVALGAGTP
jgi:hypothetical protein